MWMLGYAFAGLLGLLALSCLIILIRSKFQHPKKILLIVAMVICGGLSPVVMNAATAVVGPDVTEEPPGVDDGFDDDLDLDDDEL